MPAKKAKLPEAPSTTSQYLQLESEVVAGMKHILVDLQARNRRILQRHVVNMLMKIGLENYSPDRAYNYMPPDVVYED